MILHVKDTDGNSHAVHPMHVNGVSEWSAVQSFEEKTAGGGTLSYSGKRGMITMTTGAVIMTEYSFEALHEMWNRSLRAWLPSISSAI